MSLLIETILIDNGEPQHLNYHQQRFNATRKSLFNAPPMDLCALIIPPSHSGLFRCRILYDNSIHDISYSPYTKHPIRKLLLKDENISYPYKYHDRPFETPSLKESDTLYHHNGIITDTSICNVAFLDEHGTWHTPQYPLLKGTTRERLLDSGFLTPSDINITHLQFFKKIAIMNALRGFEILGSPKDVILSLFCYNTKS